MSTYIIVDDNPSLAASPAGNIHGKPSGNGLRKLTWKVTFAGAATDTLVVPFKVSHLVGVPSPAQYTIDRTTDPIKSTVSFTAIPAGAQSVAHILEIYCFN